MPAPNREGASDLAPPSIKLGRTLLEDGPERVIAGFHTVLQCAVAVEVLPDATTEEAVAHFTRRARLLSQLDHGNCARVEEFGETERGWFAVYRGEYIGVEDLELPLAPSQAVELSRGVLAALTHAHDMGIFHGDLGTHSLLLPRDDLGQVKVRGFAKTLDVGTPAGLVREDLSTVAWIVLRLVTGAGSADVSSGTFGLVPPALRRLIARLRGERDPYPDAKAALDDLERNFGTTTGLLSAPSLEIDSGPQPVEAYPVDSPQLEATPTAPPEPRPPAPPPTPVAAATLVQGTTIEPLEAPRGARRSDARGLYIALAALGTAVAAVAIVLVLSLGGSSTPVAGPAPAAAPPEVTTPGASVAAAAAAAPDLFQLLARVNAEDVARGMGFEKRHALLAQIREHPSARDLVDEKLQLALDLEQAASTDQPCVEFRRALHGIVANIDPYFQTTVAVSKPPASADPACDGLDTELAELKLALGFAKGPPAVSTPTPTRKKSAARKARRAPRPSAASPTPRAAQPAKRPSGRSEVKDPYGN